MSNFREHILSTTSPMEREQWKRAASIIDVYYTPEYVDVFSGVEGGTGHVYLLEDRHGNRVIYPFVRRDLARVDNIGRDGQGLSDIITPYGYGGPVYVGSLTCRNQMMFEFRRSFHNYCLRERIVSEFVRYHPLLCNHSWEPEDVDVAAVRTTVMMRTGVDDEAVMSQLPPKTRSMVRRAISANVTVRYTTSPSVEELRDFCLLYADTMTRRNAEGFYLFSTDTIREMFRRMPRSIALFAASTPSEGVMSSAIILRGHRAIHYHLAGSDLQRMPPGTNNLLLMKAAVWGYSVGVPAFHLGGGYSEGDGLFRFKASMSPERRQFAVGKVIHDEVVYGRLAQILLARCGLDQNTDFFPMYRTGR